jgi:hypothetical protein
MIESRNCQYKNHLMITTGIHEGTRAAGCFGLMPKTVQSILKMSPKMRERYGFLQDMTPAAITSSLNMNEKMDRDLAFFLWQHLRKKFSPERASMGWYRGEKIAQTASGSQMRQCSYVQRFVAEMKHRTPKIRHVTVHLERPLNKRPSNRPIDNLCAFLFVKKTFSFTKYDIALNRRYWENLK